MPSVLKYFPNARLVIMPKISVIMPCFNHGHYVGESIEAVLAQTVADLELIVVDDCSRDHSRTVIARYVECDRRVRAIYHRANLGASRSRNDGMALARGEFMAFCDADDVWLPTKLEHQMEALRKHPECDVAYCDAKIIDECGGETGKRFSEWFPVPGSGSGKLFLELCTRNFINMQTAILRRECIAETICFDESIKFVEDWCFWLDVSRGHRFLYLNEVLASYREHCNSTALVEQRGYKINRLKAFHRTMRLYPWIPLKLKSEIYYQMGAALSWLGKPVFSRGCYTRSLAARRWNPQALGRLLLSYIQ